MTITVACIFHCTVRLRVRAQIYSLSDVHVCMIFMKYLPGCYTVDSRKTFCWRAKRKVLPLKWLILGLLCCCRRIRIKDGLVSCKLLFLILLIVSGVDIQGAWCAYSLSLTGQHTAIQQTAAADCELNCNVTDDNRWPQRSRS